MLRSAVHNSFSSTRAAIDEQRRRCAGRVPPTDPTRSRIMSRVRSTGNLTTELRLIALMRAEHITGWRRGIALPGKPDFVFRKRRVAIFVDGCFWHGCNCKRLPVRHHTFWAQKIDRNRRRDTSVREILRDAGWRVMRIWEHQLKRNPKLAVRRLKRVLGIET
jgi:DNA mismatch endonuclease, patch repair protein